MNDEPWFELRGHVAVLRRRRWFLLVVTAAATSGVLFYAFLRTPVYESNAEVLVRPIALVPTQPSRAATPNLQIERRVATSAEVTALADAKLGRAGVAMGTISVDASASDSTLHFTATASDRIAAQRTAQAFTESYLELLRRHALEDLAAARKPLQTQIDEDNRQLKALRGQILATRDGAQRAALRMQLDPLVSEQLALQQSLHELILPENLRVGQILRPATRPRSPSWPSDPVTGALMLLVGLPLGVGLTLLRDHLDQRVRGPEELGELTGAPVLAVVPRMARRGEPPDRMTVDLEAEAADVYRDLCRKVVAIASRSRLQFLTIASSDGRQAKVTAHLGVALAQAGKRVILIAAEPGGSRLRQLFALPDRWATDGQTPPGSAAAGDPQSLWARCWVLHDNLFLFLPPEDLDPPAPSRLPGLRAELQEAADFILVDGAPIPEMVKGSRLTPPTDGVLVVVDAQRATRPSVRAAQRQLDQAGVVVVGAVLVHDAGRRRERDAAPAGPLAADGHATPVLLNDQGAVEAELLQFLRSRPSSADGRPERPLVVVTGDRGEQGKSTVAAEVAFALASDGKRVALVDLDLSHPTQHRILDLPQGAGLAEVALDGVPLEQAMHRFEVSPEHGPPDLDPDSELPVPGSVEVLTAGALPAGEEAAVTGPIACTVVDLVRERADVVLVDAPPMRRVDDALSLLPKFDALVVVNGRERERSRLLDRAPALDEQAAPNLGREIQAQAAATRAPGAGDRIAAKRADAWLAASIAVGGAITLLLAPTHAKTVVRPVVTLLFIGFAPGAAFVWLLRGLDLPTKIVASIALSLAVGTVTAQAMIWFHAWSPTAGLVALVSLSMVGLVLQGWQWLRVPVSAR